MQGKKGEKKKRKRQMMQDRYHVHLDPLLCSGSATQKVKKAVLDSRRINVAWETISFVT